MKGDGGNGYYNCFFVLLFKFLERFHYAYGKAFAMNFIGYVSIPAFSDACVF